MFILICDPLLWSYLTEFILYFIFSELNSLNLFCVSFFPNLIFRSCSKPISLVQANSLLFFWAKSHFDSWLLFFSSQPGSFRLWSKRVSWHISNQHCVNPPISGYVHNLILKGWCSEAEAFQSPLSHSLMLSFCDAFRWKRGRIGEEFSHFFVQPSFPGNRRLHPISFSRIRLMIWRTNWI